MNKIDIYTLEKFIETAVKLDCKVKLSLTITSVDNETLNNINFTIDDTLIHDYSYILYTFMNAYKETNSEIIYTLYISSNINIDTHITLIGNIENETKND